MRLLSLGRRLWTRGGGLSEGVVALALAVLAGALFLRGGARLDPGLADFRASNVWFDSDIPYRLEAMVSGAGGDNGGAHPLFPGIGHLLLAAASRARREADPWGSARLALAVVGGAWVGVSYGLLRRLRLPPLDAALFSAIGAVSAGALFWFTVPESFGLSGLGTTLALLGATAANASPLALAAGCAASASFVLSNGAVGACAVLAHHPRLRDWGRALACLFAGLGLLTGLWAVQEWSRPTPFFLGDRLLEYRQHLFPVTPARVVEVVPALLTHSMVAPALRNDTPSFRKMHPGTAGLAGAIATAAWLVLLALGGERLWRLGRAGELARFGITVAGGLAALLGLHLSLGREMFLYAMNFVPLLLPVAALSARSEPRRALVRAVAMVLLVTAAANNLGQLAAASHAARELTDRRLAATPRE